MNADLFLRKKSDGLGESIGARANMIPFFKLGGRGGVRGGEGGGSKQSMTKRKLKRNS